ncbi:hypothetical protein HZH66_000642 [Vespula vulgaris]|uniref:Uncharacterized protein n=2 Tax=Vespula TaxID=7451 RepID=A0A834KTL8_VESVU|nr:hypothetical protein HZH66_000642 [Vespula vulgaris]
MVPFGTIVILTLSFKYNSTRQHFNRKTGARMHSRGIKSSMVPTFGSIQLITCLWIGCAVWCLVQATDGQHFYLQTRYGKRDVSRADVPVRYERSAIYHTNGRYGRSESKISAEPSRPVKIVPRNNMFFLGSRYGKRSLEDQRMIYHSEYPLERLDAVLEYVDEARRIAEARKNQQEDLREEDERQDDLEAGPVLPFQ